MPVAIVFDLDGVLVDSEQLWDDARREVASRRRTAWTSSATTEMQGMSSTEWARYMVERLGVPGTPASVSDAVVAGMLARYDRGLPLLPCAAATVASLAARWPLGLASSSNREVIDHVLQVSGLVVHFASVVSSEEVARGKPAPDVYLEAARRLGTRAAACVAVEDSANGIRAAHAAGSTVVAVPNPRFPPSEEVLDLAGDVCATLCELTVERVEALA